MSLGVSYLDNDAILNGEWRFTEYAEDLITAESQDGEYLLTRSTLLEKLATLDSDLYQLKTFYECDVCGVAIISEDDYFIVLEQTSVNRRKLTLIDNSDIQNSLEKLLLNAVNLGASDLHITRNDNIAQVEFRINGVLSVFTQMKSDRCDELSIIHASERVSLIHI